MHPENTRIYQRSIELNVQVGRITRAFPSGYAWLSDQLRRAACSVTLNFAEGCRRTSRKERRRFFIIASASAAEVSAACDVASAHAVVTDDDNEAVRGVAAHLVAMLRLFT